MTFEEYGSWWDREKSEAITRLTKQMQLKLEKVCAESLFGEHPSPGLETNRQDYEGEFERIAKWNPPLDQEISWIRRGGPQKWIIDRESQEPDDNRTTCSCDMDLLLMRGCQCGGE